MRQCLFHSPAHHRRLCLKILKRDGKSRCTSRQTNQMPSQLWLSVKSMSWLLKTAMVSAWETHRPEDMTRGTVQCSEGRNTCSALRRSRNENTRIYGYVYFIYNFHPTSGVSPDFHLSLSAWGLCQASSRRGLCSAAQWWSTEEMMWLFAVLGLMFDFWWQEEWSWWPVDVEEFLYV